MMKIREVRLEDAPGMLDIYKYYVEKTPITFELKVPTVEEFQSRISKYTQKFPWIILEEEQQTLGYAYANSFRDREAYQWTAESTVYVRDGFASKGFGRELYNNLFARLREQGVVNVIGGITLPNEPSVRLHEKCGFVKVADIKDAGFKLGRWWDVGYWQLQFAKPEQPVKLKLPR